MSLTAKEARKFNQQTQNLVSRSFEIIKARCDNAISGAMNHNLTETEFIIPVIIFGEAAYDRTKAFDMLANSLVKRGFKISTTFAEFVLVISWESPPLPKKTKKTKSDKKESSLEKAKRLGEQIKRGEL